MYNSTKTAKKKNVNSIKTCTLKNPNEVSSLVFLSPGFLFLLYQGGSVKKDEIQGGLGKLGLEPQLNAPSLKTIVENKSRNTRGLKVNDVMCKRSMLFTFTLADP